MNLFLSEPHETGTIFTISLAVSVDVDISMGSTEPSSEDGEISGCSSPVKHGVASGVMTSLGGLDHALSFFIPDFYTAKILAIALVVFEL